MTYKELNLNITESDNETRLDKFLALHPEIATRARAQHLIDEGLVTIAGKVCKSSTTVKYGQQVRVQVPVTPSATEIIPLDRPIKIVFEDTDVIVINKPAGLVVHPAAGHEQDTLVNMLVAHTRQLSMKFNEMRPGIVHRIDKETSGLLVIAKNDSAHENLTQQFKARAVSRKYEALCLGEVKPASGKIESYLGRHPTDRKRFASQKDHSGKIAITNYKVLGVSQGLSYLEIKLETGRTHQIRVHMSEKGHPLVGDRLYQFQKKMHLVKSNVLAEKIKSLDRFMLHARDLGFNHPRTGDKMFFTVDWPQSELDWLKELGFKK